MKFYGATLFKFYRIAILRSNLRGGRQIAPWLGIYAVSRHALRWNLASIAMAARRDAQAAVALLNFKI